METWKIMIGLQVLTTTISLIATILYMRKPEEEGDNQ